MTHEQTPAQQAGFEVGDRAVVTDQNTFQLGSVIRLERDDGDHCPLWALESGKIIRCERFPGKAFCRLDRVQKLSTTDYTPQPGDYVRTANLTESEYHQVAALFMAAGAERGQYPDWILAQGLDAFGWDIRYSHLYHMGIKSQDIRGGPWYGGTELTLHDGRLVPVESVSEPDWSQLCADSIRRYADGSVCIRFAKPDDYIAHGRSTASGTPHADSDVWQELHLLRRRVEKLESHGTETPDQDIRPTGFYWVDTSPTGRGYWEPAEYNQVRREWHVLHDDAPMVDSDFNTIGPRIHPPEE